MNINGVECMEKKLLGFICSVLLLLLTGCSGNHLDPEFRDMEAYDETNGFEASLHLTYDEFREKYGQKYAEQNNGFCRYMMAQNRMPEDRQVNFSFFDIHDDLGESETVEITSNKISISNERMLGSKNGRHFPVDTVVAMTGSGSFEAMQKSIGLPMVYEELGDFCAFAFEGYSSTGYTVTVYFGNKEHTDSVKIDLSKFHQAYSSLPSLQITENDIFYFENIENSYDSYITVTQIPKNKGKISTKKIQYSEVELPNLRNLYFKKNIFVDNGYLFFMGSFVTSQTEVNGLLPREFDIIMYDLKTDKHDTYRLENINNFGKLFRYNSGLGLMTFLYDEWGYSTNLSVSFFDIDKNNCKLLMNSELPLTISTPWAYFFTGSCDFFCVGDTLCGVMIGREKGTTYVYAEFDLKSGETTTFIPIARNKNKAYYWATYGSVQILDSRGAVSPHNCNTF